HDLEQVLPHDIDVGKLVRHANWQNLISSLPTFNRLDIQIAADTQESCECRACILKLRKFHGPCCRILQ
ncbi:hypothetical protein DWV02_25440, partial [Citrobacter freundii]